MTPSFPARRRAWLAPGLAAVLALAVTGAVMADTHVPVARAPDAGPRVAGA